MNLLPFIIAGLVIGSVYALSGVGVLVLYRTTGVLNFAHGAIGGLSAMLAWQAMQLRLLPGVAIGFSIVVGAVVAYLFGLVAGPYLARIDELRKAVTTLGFALVLLGVMLYCWNDKARTMQLPTSRIAFSIGDGDRWYARINLTQLLCLALAVLVVVATGLALRYTSTGSAMRALASDRELAAVLGTRVRVVESLAWVLSGAIGAASGVVVADQTRLEPAFLTFLIIPELAAVVIGRFRSLSITLLAGLGVGVGQSLVSSQENLTAFSTAVPFLLATLFIVLTSGRRVVSIGVVRE